ncbi:hypothetical protein ACFLMW_003776 [Salmonella enterica]
MHNKLLTPEATEALNWMIDRMPDSMFAMFVEEMEAAISTAAQRFGFNHELIEAFNVKRLVADREGLEAADEVLQNYQAHIFTGKHTYAVLGNGKVFRKKGNAWFPAPLTIDEVLACSITRVPGTVAIKAKYI